jgi:hypothetical protein
MDGRRESGMEDGEERGERRESEADEGSEREERTGVVTQGKKGPLEPPNDWIRNETG